MTESRSKFLKVLAVVINSAAVGLTVLVLAMDCSAFLFWLTLGVFDGHWNDISLQVLFVCLIVSFLFLLIVSAMFGLGNQLNSGANGPVKILNELGALIDSGWDKALRTSITCSMVVLALLVGLCLSFWRDLLWWSELCRGMRATNEGRTAAELYEASADIATPDRKPISFILIASDAYDQNNLRKAERYFNQAIESIKSLKGDSNRTLLISAYLGLARTLMKEGRSDTAEQILRQALALFESGKKPLPPVLVRFFGPIQIPSPSPPPTQIGTYTLVELACVKQGKYAEAQKLFEENLSRFYDMDKPNIKAIITITEMYADMVSELKDEQVKFVNEAYEHALKLVATKFGDGSDELGRIQVSYGNRLKSLGRSEEAVAMYVSAIENLKKTVKESDATLLRTMNNLAGLYAKAGNVEEAEVMYKQEIALVQQWMGLLKKWEGLPPDVQIQYDACRADYAKLLRQLNREDEAKGLEVETSTAPHK